MTTDLQNVETVSAFQLIDNLGLSFRLLLDEVAALIRAHQGHQAIARLMSGLKETRASAGVTRWTQELIPMARDHDLCSLILECPFTSHAYRRPRGYPGDAALLDIIYEHPSSFPAVQSASARGLSIFDFLADVAACRAVRERRQILADAIDAAARETADLRVLSLACGHLREAELSAAIQGGAVREMAALDQDLESLAVVKQYGTPVTAWKKSVKDIIARRHEFEDFNLVYSAGLYDYLDVKTAALLTQRLFGLLTSGGKLLVANFLSGIHEECYMEAFMRWNLIYRDKSEICAFAANIPEDIRSSRYFVDEAQCIGYLEITRA